MYGIGLDKLEEIAEGLALAFYLLMFIAVVTLLAGSADQGFLLLLAGAVAHVGRAGLEREPVRPPLDYPADHARLLQHLQVLGDGGLGHVEPLGDFPDGRRSKGETFDDPAPDRVRERLE